MKIRVLGGGFYGCHISLALLKAGHQVELHELSDRLFFGASGGIPARVHLGFHYPRSRLTRAACLSHQAQFMRAYGHLTRGVPVNIYAVAAQDSIVDFGTYRQVLAPELEFVTIYSPGEYGLAMVEGALLTGERHIVTDLAITHFERELAGFARFEMAAGAVDDPRWDLTIDCTFCANEAANVDRYEPCVTGLLAGPTDRAVTIMDGPFPSLYPWNEDRGLSSITSASFTPFARCATRAEAVRILSEQTQDDIQHRLERMVAQMSIFWPAVQTLYRIVDYRLSIRAMPRSGADARLVDVIRVGSRSLRVRAGKIDAVLDAERLVFEHLSGSRDSVVAA